VDLEDMALTADWLISFQKELRIHLPVGQYIITHAPEAGYIVPGSTYAQFNQAMGGTVDFYNLQFYNIGSSRYGQSDNVANFGVDTSSPSLQEIKNIGFDPAKLVMGFPVIPEDAMDDQHLSAEAIHQAALAATAWGWPYTGIMGWQYKPGTNIAQTWAAAALP
jgi:chitinase